MAIFLNTSSLTNHSIVSFPDSPTPTHDQFVESVTNVLRYSSALVVLLLTLNIVMEILTILGNLTVILTIVAYRHLWVPSNTFLASLAVADLVIGLFLQSSNAWNLLNALLQGKRACDLRCTKIIYVMGIVIVTVSLAHLSLITLDRYTAIMYPFRYVTIMTMSRTKKAVVFAWTMSFVFGLLAAISSTFGVRINILWHIFIVVTCLFMITLYGRLYALSRKHAKKIRDEVRIVTPGAATKAERQGLVTVAIVTVAMATSYIPLVAIKVDKKLASGERGKNAKLVYDTLNQFAIILVLFNSTINPVVYFFRSKKLRTYSCRLIRSIVINIQSWIWT